MYTLTHTHTHTKTSASLKMIAHSARNDECAREPTRKPAGTNKVYVTMELFLSSPTPEIGKQEREQYRGLTRRGFRSQYRSVLRPGTRATLSGLGKEPVCVSSVYL